MAEPTLDFENDLLAFYNDPQRPQGVRQLLLYCSVPCYLTTDLVYALRDAMGIDDDTPDAVEDIINARFVQRMTGPYRRMDRAVREVLRYWLRKEYGRDIETQLGAFLKRYIEDTPPQSELFWQEYREAQVFTALAVLKPDQAAREIVQAVVDSYATPEDRERALIKWAALAEEAALDLRRVNGEPVVEYVRCFADTARGRPIAYMSELVRQGFSMFGVKLPGLQVQDNVPETESGGIAPAAEPPAPEMTRIGRKITAIGHQRQVQRLFWSNAAGQEPVLLSSGQDHTLRTWQISEEASNDEHVTLPLFQVAELESKRMSSSEVQLIAWSPDGQWLAAAVGARVDVRPMIANGPDRWSAVLHDQPVTCLDWSPDGRLIATGSRDGRVGIWDAETGARLQKFVVGHEVGCVRFSPDSSRLAVGMRAPSMQIGAAYYGLASMIAIRECTIYLFDLSRRSSPSANPVVCYGHSDDVTDLAWWHSDQNADGDPLRLISCSSDRLLIVWDMGGNSLIRLKAHDDAVTRLTLSHDGALLASASRDRTIRFWSCRDDFAHVYTMGRDAITDPASQISFHPHKPLLAFADQRTHISLIAFDFQQFHDHYFETPTVIYSAVKIVIVGDGGAGKTQLARALVGEKFEEQFGTHALNVLTLRVPTQATAGKHAIREVYLYDLAGQGDYQLIHQLYLNHMAAALLVFNADGSDPLARLRRWDLLLQQIQYGERAADGVTPPSTLKKYLVEARSDQKSIGYGYDSTPLERALNVSMCFRTSARTGEGIDDLRAALLTGIDWEHVPQDVTTVLFEQVRSFLASTQQSGRRVVPLDDLFDLFAASEAVTRMGHMPDLRPQFEQCLRFLEARQVIRWFDPDRLVLLFPELLNIYAAAIIDAARNHELLTINAVDVDEDALLEYDLGLKIEQRIPIKAEEQQMIRATIDDLLRYEVALREDGRLIFPSHIATGSEGDLDLNGLIGGENVIYTFNGVSLNLYATLIVRLVRTRLFKQFRLGRYKALLTLYDGGLVGVALATDEEGVLRLYFSNAPSDIMQRALDYFVFEHLHQRALPGSVRRRQVVYCTNSDCPSEPRLRFPRQHIEARAHLGRFDIQCPICGAMTPFDDPSHEAEAPPLSREANRLYHDLERWSQDWRSPDSR
ncbi:MAG: hypothetical protein U0670_08935 [Anaerolineae bacterium]